LTVSWQLIRHRLARRENESRQPMLFINNHLWLVKIAKNPVVFEKSCGIMILFRYNKYNHQDQIRREGGKTLAKRSSSMTQDDSAHILGSRIRELRKTKKMRVIDLANMTELTSSMISQVERGGISPSIDTLKRIANSLNVSVGYFFEDEDKLAGARIQDGPNPNDQPDGPYKNLDVVEISPVVHEHHRKILSPGKGVTYYLLNPNMDGPIEFIYNVYEPGCGTGERLYSHPGSECGLILEGELIVTILDKPYRLKKGDSITFDSSQPHSKQNDGTVPCICVWANTPPYF
jgi:transcriptional regulator with XRE-family HTH domain